MEIPSIMEVEICESPVDRKVTGQVNLIGLWNDKHGCPESDKYYEENKIKHYLFQLGYEEMKKISEAKEKIDKERARKSLFRKIGDLVAIVQENQPAGPEFSLEVNCEAADQRIVELHIPAVKLHIPAVKEKYRYAKGYKVLNFSSQAASLSAAMEKVHRRLSQYIKIINCERYLYIKTVSCRRYPYI